MARLLILAGILLIIGGGITAYPMVREASLPPPSTFGAGPPPLRPTVTPLPVEGQLSISATPVLLPETPLFAPAQTLPPLIAAAITDPSLHVPTRIVIPAIHLDAPIEAVGWSQPNGVSVWDTPIISQRVG